MDKKDDAECSFEGKFAKGNDGKEIHLTVFEDCPRKSDSILKVSKAGWFFNVNPFSQKRAHVDRKLSIVIS